jgi:hypothetical protein
MVSPPHAKPRQILVIQAILLEPMALPDKGEPMSGKILNPIIGKSGGNPVKPDLCVNLKIEIFVKCFFKLF